MITLCLSFSSYDLGWCEQIVGRSISLFIHKEETIGLVIILPKGKVEKRKRAITVIGKVVVLWRWRVLLFVVHNNPRKDRNGEEKGEKGRKKN